MRNTLISAFSNLSTAYNLVNINLAHVEMENQYCGGDNCKGSVTTAGTACLVGAIIGQLTFGYVGDCLGRGRALQLTMVLTISGAFLSAFAIPLTSDPTSVFVCVSITRFFLGVGVGGVYPLAAIIASESSNDSNRGRNGALVFSMQGVGVLLVPIMGMIFLYGFGSFEERNDANQAVTGIGWRLILGVGALPGMILIFIKTTKKEDAVTTGALPTQPLFQPNKMSLGDALKTPRYWRKLIGCAGGWFLFDITFYGNTLFAPTILKEVFHNTKASGLTPTIGSTLATNLCWQLMILALLGLPGYYVSVCLMDSVGRKNIQVQGFVFMFFAYGGLGVFLTQLEKSSVLLLMVYGLTYFFSNFGPNSTTFLLPAESFPEEVRSTLNGFCAASGKLGATVGAASFKPVVNAFGSGTAFMACAVCAVLGVLITVLCVEDRRGKGMASADSFVAERDKTDAASVRDRGISLHD